MAFFNSWESVDGGGEDSVPLGKVEEATGLLCPCKTEVTFWTTFISQPYNQSDDIYTMQDDKQI